MKNMLFWFNQSEFPTFVHYVRSTAVTIFFQCASLAHSYVFDMASIHVRNFKFPTEQVLYLYILLIQHVRSLPSRKWTPSIPLYRHSKYFFRMYFARNIVCATKLGHFMTLRGPSVTLGYDSDWIHRSSPVKTRALVPREDIIAGVLKLFFNTPPFMENKVVVPPSHNYNRVK